ncbi:MAG: hypothetical protein JSS69_12895 [Acidobacteria bacterium]|nr:hypothetical protein [Acidobacteriota bacterium]
MTFPISNQADQILNVSYLLSLPNLEEPLLEGVRRYSSKLVPATRHTFIRALRNGFVEYLKQQNPSTGLSDVDTNMLWSYVRWQDSPRATAKGERTLSPATSMKRIGAVRMVMESLRNDSTWGIAVSLVLKNFPRNTHKGSLEHQVPRAILSRDDLEAIHCASLIEIEEIRARMQEGVRLLDQGNASLANGERDYSQLAIALAAMVERYPRVFPSGQQILKDDRQLGRAIFLRSWGEPKPLGLLRLARYRYANARDLVPFVLALVIEGAYNSDTVLGITKAGVRTRTLMGVTVTTVEGPKGRAKSGLYAKDLDPEVVGPWFALLDQLTALLRSNLPDHQQHRIFVYQPRAADFSAKAFSHPQGGPSSDICWKNSLKAFCRRHGLPAFSLAQLRPTLLDQVGQRQGSLVASRAGQHQNFQTTDNHYLGPGTRERERERLGETVQQFERFITSESKVDVRRAARAYQDKGAATPGFVCLEPYASPILGQRKHRLCRAYGACPICALSVGDIKDPLAVAFWLALERAIFRARETLDPQHWLRHWAPIAARLMSMLRQVSEAVITEAHRYCISLPPVG